MKEPTVNEPPIRPQHHDGVRTRSIASRAAHAFGTLFCVLASLAVLAACGAPAQPVPPASGPVAVVATTPMLADLIRRIGGDDVEVRGLLGEGVDPHLYKPTRTDVAVLVAAEVVVANGLMLEGRMQDAFDRAKEAGRTVVRYGELLPKDRLLAGEEAGEESGDEKNEHADPHVWMDPDLWAAGAKQLAALIADRRPGDAELRRRLDERAAAFERFASTFAERIDAAVASVPAERRVLVTAHDAFGYFGRRFGLEVRGVQGLSTESEAGLADLERLVAFLVERRIPAVFVESTVSPRTIEALIAGAKAQGHDVVIGGQLYSDSMGPSGTAAGTWPGMIAHNVETLVGALGGAVPEGGVLPREADSAREGGDDAPPA
jgi:manganese/zinc/iron transport system substrate-binding protein